MERGGEAADHRRELCGGGARRRGGASPWSSPEPIYLLAPPGARGLSIDAALQAMQPENRLEKREKVTPLGLDAEAWCHADTRRDRSVSCCPIVLRCPAIGSTTTLPLYLSTVPPPANDPFKHGESRVRPMRGPARSSQWPSLLAVTPSLNATSELCASRLSATKISLIRWAATRIRGRSM